MSKKILPILISLIIPGLALAQNATSLPAYISNVFTWSIRIGGLVAFGAFVYGGIRYLTSTGNVEAINEATKYMTGALIALAVLLGSYALLNTINPDLVNPRSEWKLPEQGVCFYGEGKEQPYCTSNNERKSNFGTSTFEPSKVEFRSDRTELKGIYVFKKENWEGEKKLVMNTGEEYHEASLPYTPKSFYLFWETPGATVYQKPQFEASFPDQPFRRYQNDVSDLEDFKNNVRSISYKGRCRGIDEDSDGIVEELINEVDYASVLHTETDQEGGCAIAFGDFIIKIGSISTQRCLGRGIWDLEGNPTSLRGTIGSNVSSITVFNYAFEGNESGGVSFYDQPNHAGNSFTVEADDIEDHPSDEIGYYWEEDISYPHSGNPEDLDQILSMKIQGDYLVVLTTQNGLEGRCQAFRGTDKDLKSSYIIPRAIPEHKVKSISIIPLK